MSKILLKLLSFFFIIFLTLFLSARHNFVRSAANHIVISEVQISGTVSTEDFVELYNPTDNPIDLTNYRLVKRTSSGSADTNIASFQSGDVIPAHGFFLWCNNGISEILSCDRSTAQTVSNNNSLGLRDGDVDTGTLVDSITFGSPSYPLGEGTFIGLGSAQVPGQNESIERKACSNSTFSTMNNGDSFNGNSEDTDNNSNDFINRISPDPQNSSSSVETPSCGNGSTPTPTVDPTPTIEPTATPTLEPTVTPTETPTITPMPTELPSETPTATPSIEPTITPTTQPTPTEEPSPTPTPAGRIIGRFIFPGYVSTCRLTLEVHRFGFFFYIIPNIVCN